MQQRWVQVFYKLLELIGQKGFLLKHIKSLKNTISPYVILIQFFYRTNEVLWIYRVPIEVSIYLNLVSIYKLEIFPISNY